MNRRRDERRDDSHWSPDDTGELRVHIDSESKIWRAVVTHQVEEMSRALNEAQKHVVELQRKLDVTSDRLRVTWLLLCMLISATGWLKVRGVV